MADKYYYDESADEEWIYHEGDIVSEDKLKNSKEITKMEWHYIHSCKKNIRFGKIYGGGNTMAKVDRGNHIQEVIRWCLHVDVNEIFHLESNDEDYKIDKNGSLMFFDDVDNKWIASSISLVKLLNGSLSIDKTWRAKK